MQVTDEMRIAAAEAYPLAFSAGWQETRNLGAASSRAWNAALGAALSVGDTTGAPVDGAEPVAWLVLVDGLPFSAYLSEALARECVDFWSGELATRGVSIAALGRLPVSSQDAGALVDLVLPAEGERRTAQVELVAQVIRVAARYSAGDAAETILDALREAAAGKAGSDDA